jgi:aryl-alcohol dehydrogenase-like predicted oxidoreductase
METRTLGRSGIEVGAIGAGCWAIGGPWTYHPEDRDPHPAGWGEVDDAESARAIQAALDGGVTLFDTAANYGAGHSERVLGRALGRRRHDVVVATKFGYLVDEETRDVRADHSMVLPNLRRDCEASLRRLGTDYIDVYQFHVGDYDPTRAAEIRDGLEELVAEGKVRWYGWSTDSAEGARVFAEGKHCTAVQFAYNVFSEKFDLRSVLADSDLGGIARSPLAMGILTGKMTSETTFPADDVRTELDFTEGRHAALLSVGHRLQTVLTERGHTAAQGALSWILSSDQRIVPIPGFRTAAQVTENLATLEAGLLSLDQMTRIEGIRAASIDTVGAFYNPPADAEGEEESAS